MLTNRLRGASGPIYIDPVVWGRMGTLGLVGPTSEWSLSVCPRHDWFGGVMSLAELEHPWACVVSGTMRDYARYNVHGSHGEEL